MKEFTALAFVLVASSFLAVFIAAKMGDPTMRELWRGVVLYFTMGAHCP